MTENQREKLVKNILLQVELNRLAHGEGKRTTEEWSMIAQIHMGHLTEAVMKRDNGKIEKEILHVAAPLVEMYQDMFQEANERTGSQPELAKGMVK